MRTISIVDEFRITAEMRQEICSLLALCFPDEPVLAQRPYLKQIPPRRVLVREESQLVGHAGLEYRVIGFCEGPAHAFGIVDLCVHPRFQSHGIASSVLDAVSELATRSQASFLLLFAKDQRIYRKHDYRPVENEVRWLKIHEHRSLSVGSEKVPEMMIRQMGTTEWPEGPVDLLGHLF
jgi:ribosomal protein S18 acetylase RimI-like enzyme